MSRILGAMSNRIFAILLLGIIASAMLTWWLAFGERQKVIGQFRDYHIIDHVEHLLQALDSVPAKDRAAFLALANRRSMRLEILEPNAPQPQLAASDEFANNLGTRLGAPFRVQALLDKPDACREPRRAGGWNGNGWNMGRPPPPPVCEKLLLTLPDSSRLLLTVVPSRNPVPPPPRPDWSFSLIFILSVGVLAFVVARMTMRPLANLAQAASNLGRDINHPPLEIKGATEIRQASRAFNAMQARLRKHITQRTQMLAAITHDLQTPLTRLRLRLEKVDDEELRDKLIGDLSAMQQMVREGLDLARSIDSTEAMQKIDIDSLLDSICSDAVEAGQAVELTGQVGLAIFARPVALRRCLVNLIDNAVKYGKQAKVSITAHEHTVSIRIRDAGPGIPDDELSRVFEPFYRLESSRSRESGGTGLGLTIALNVAEQHGGSLTLVNHVQGGLEACLQLPTAID